MCKLNYSLKLTYRSKDFFKPDKTIIGWNSKYSKRDSLCILLMQALIPILYLGYVCCPCQYHNIY